MNIAWILYPVKVLGPGDRLGIWVSGCRRRCQGCSNPELWERQPQYKIALPRLKKLIEGMAAKHTIDGFTISGGEPFEQSKELSELIVFLRAISDDILVYTGYSADELRENLSDDVKSILDSIAVLIDGEYIEERNTDVMLRGSDNQTISILNPKYKEKYHKYIETGYNQIQNFTTIDGLVSVGIHRKGFTNSKVRQLFQRNMSNEGDDQQ